MAEIQVTPWNTREQLPNDPTAPLHDCLWQIAQEQAVLERMKSKSESWETASGKVSRQDVRKHLDTVCDDNGFRRLDGSGTGRDPNLIYGSDRIKVRIDPKQLGQAPNGVSTKQTGDAYSKAVASADGKGGPDLNKKIALDNWLGNIQPFANFSEGTKTGLINAYNTAGVNPDNLAKLAGSNEFLMLGEKSQQQLLTVYGTQGKAFATAEVDKIVAGTAGEDEEARLKVFGSHGYFNLPEPVQKVLLDRYNSDGEFRAALNQIVGQNSYKDRNSTEQAHALDILVRYSERKGEGYGEQPADTRTTLLVTLYNEVLSKPEFKLLELGKDGKPDTDAQTKAIDNFAENRASEIGGTQAPEPKKTAPVDDPYD